MDCTESLELLSEYYEKTLDNSLIVQVQTHLVSCITCADVYRDLEVIVESSVLLRNDEYIVFPDENKLWQRIDSATH
jgi:hypothetical protein